MAGATDTPHSTITYQNCQDNLSCPGDQGTELLVRWAWPVPNRVPNDLELSDHLSMLVFAGTDCIAAALYVTQFVVSLASAALLFKENE
ncbi:MAG: hypothetical protein ABJL67_17475 [Sulfitobacter sp.]